MTDDELAAIGRRAEAATDHVNFPLRLLVNCKTQYGPEIVCDGEKEPIATIHVQHEVWTCDDPEDGCDDVSGDARACAEFWVSCFQDVPRLIAEIRRLRAGKAGG